jgi:hypothetical protein
MRVGVGFGFEGGRRISTSEVRLSSESQSIETLLNDAGLDLIQYYQCDGIRTTCTAPGTLVSQLLCKRESHAQGWPSSCWDTRGHGHLHWAEPAKGGERRGIDKTYGPVGGLTSVRGPVGITGQPVDVLIMVKGIPLIG